MRRAICPGSFDPVTMGHLNIIRRAAVMFDEVIVCVMVNSAKHGLFTPEERVELLQKSTDGIPNVKVDMATGLLADYARKKDAWVLVKGLRAVSDYEVERQMAMINNKLNHRLDTVFLYTKPKYAYLSSTIVKEMARYGVDLSGLVPRQIVEDVQKRMQESLREKE